MSSTSLVHRPSPMLTSILDRLVGLAAAFLDLCFANASASSASISEISGTSSWFLNKALGLNCSTFCSSNSLQKFSSSNILYEKRLVFLLNTG